MDGVKVAWGNKLSDIKVLSAKGICNKLLGSTLKQLGCWLRLFLSGSISIK